MDPLRTCIRCSTQRPRYARDLCRTCYHQTRKDGTLVDYERRCRPRGEVMEDWELLRSEGHTVAQAAERIGMKPVALFRALERAKKAGDPRAQFTWEGYGAARREAARAA